MGYCIVREVPIRYENPHTLNRITIVYIDAHINIKLFIAKIIINCENAFQPYADVWYRPLLEFLMRGGEFGNGMNYFIQDICVVLLTWGETCKMQNTYGDKVLCHKAMVRLHKWLNSFNNQYAYRIS
jgi:DNA-dependent protein kinase catalytic subunit